MVFFQNYQRMYFKFRKTELLGGEVMATKTEKEPVIYVTEFARNLAMIIWEMATNRYPFKEAMLLIIESMFDSKADRLDHIQAIENMVNDPAILKQQMTNDSFLAVKAFLDGNHSDAFRKLEMILASVIHYLTKKEGYNLELATQHAAGCYGKGWVELISKFINSSPDLEYHLLPSSGLTNEELAIHIEEEYRFMGWGND